jgi:hypothetical protein
LQTHNIALLRPLAHFAVSIGSDGKIAAQGTIPEVLGSDPSILDQLEKNTEEIKAAKGILDTPDAPKTHSKLIMAEEIEVGHIGWESGMLIVEKH